METFSRATLFCPVHARICYKGGVSISSLGKTIVLGSFLLAWPSAAQANIGDNVSQLRSHYGSINDMAGQLLFEVRLNDDGQLVPARGSSNTADHLTVTVYLDGDRSAMEVFARNTSDPVKANLDPKDIDRILAATGEGQSWLAMQDSHGKATWLRSDKKVIAKFSPNQSGKMDDASVLVVMVNEK
jgi:hypothetical protein